MPSAPGRRSDRRAELAARRARPSRVLVLIAAMVVTVIDQGVAVVLAQRPRAGSARAATSTRSCARCSEGTPLPGHGLLYFRAWPLIWGTLLTTVLAVLIALVISTLAAIFLTEFAPAAGAARRSTRSCGCSPACPRSIYGLIGILAIAPWINEHLISNARKQSVIYVVQLNGANLMTGDADPDGDDPADHGRDHAPTRSPPCPRSWREGSAALGVNRWRTIWRVSLRTARPAIAAATVLATARALGEAVMLAMVSGGARRSPPTRSTGSRSCSSPCGRWRRRSSRNPRG